MNTVRHETSQFLSQYAEKLLAHNVLPHPAVEAITPECHEKFTSKHLSKVLDKCFTSIELDDHTVTEEKERAGQAVQAERVVKGLVSKCLDKDAIAFRSLGNTKSKSKEYRLTALSECRPEGCDSAVDLFLWLVEVRGSRLCDVCAATCISLKRLMRGAVAEEHCEAEGPGGVGERVWGDDGRGHCKASDQAVQPIERRAVANCESGTRCRQEG